MGSGISAENKSANFTSQVESANEAITDNEEELSYYLLSNTTSHVKDPADAWSPEKVHGNLMYSEHQNNQAFFKGKDAVLDMMSKLTIIPQQKSSEEQTKTTSEIKEQLMNLKSER